MSYQRFGSIIHSNRFRAESLQDVTTRRIALVSIVFVALSFLLSALSFLLSVTIALFGEFRTRSGEQQHFLNETYGSYLDTDRLELDHPEIAHELASADEYREEVARVHAAFATATPEEKARLRLREEAMAFYIFSSFARLVQAQQIPEPMRTDATRRFLAAEVAYFGHDLLRNPRLVYFWRNEQGYRYYDDATVRAYAEQVRTNLQSLPADSDGPFR